MALIDKTKSVVKKKSVKKVKDASLVLKEAHLEWLLQIINDSKILGKDLELAVQTVQWLQQEYKRLHDEVRTK
jgi:uncharacterized membrane protein YcaP (DUF421 family)